MGPFVLDTDLDALHTYRGRQGADVAMLVRRIRKSCDAANLLHVGASATLAGGSCDFPAPDGTSLGR